MSNPLVPERHLIISTPNIFERNFARQRASKRRWHGDEKKADHHQRDKQFCADLLHSERKIVAVATFVADGVGDAKLGEGLAVTQIQKSTRDE
jgi:hypothetical protein